MQIQPGLLAPINASPAISARGADGGSSSDAKSRIASVPGFFISPLLKFDTETFEVLFQIRDSESGDVERQFPSESTVRQSRQQSGGEEIARREGEAEAAAVEGAARVAGDGEAEEAPATTSVDRPTVRTVETAPAQTGSDGGQPSAAADVSGVNLLT